MLGGEEDGEDALLDVYDIVSFTLLVEETDCKVQAQSARRVNIC